MKYPQTIFPTIYVGKGAMNTMFDVLGLMTRDVTTFVKQNDRDTVMNAIDVPDSSPNN